MKKKEQLKRVNKLGCNCGCGGDCGDCGGNCNCGQSNHNQNSYKSLAEILPTTNILQAVQKNLFNLEVPKSHDLNIPKSILLEMKKFGLTHKVKAVIGPMGALDPTPTGYFCYPCNATGCCGNCSNWGNCCGIVDPICGGHDLLCGAVGCSPPWLCGNCSNN